jgi:5-hydroxyisourate hydrolase
MSPITVHILDTALGQPASRVLVELFVHTPHTPDTARTQPHAKLTQLAAGHTNADGRLLDLLQPGSLHSGVYELRFDTASYFARTQRVGFYPYVSVVFEIRAADEHYHVPLLLSPFGYSTYRGT